MGAPRPTPYLLTTMNIYEKTVKAICDRRREDVDAATLKFEAALDSDVKLNAAFVAYQNESVKSARGENNELSSARKAYHAELDRLGLPHEIDPPYRCERCKDTGRVGGKYCSCVIKRVISADKENLALPLVGFEKAAKSAPSKTLEKAYDIARKYVDEYPNNIKPFLLLIGTPGTGKTVLAAATASALMKKGAATVTVTAFGFVRRALDYHTQFSIPDYIDRFTPMLDCDLLVIDDLGTESILKNVTTEYLYTVVNERWLHGKNTIITTNLPPAPLMTRYGESIASRLLDRNKATALLLDTKNARTQK